MSTVGETHHPENHFPNPLQPRWVSPTLRAPFRVGGSGAHVRWIGENGQSAAWANKLCLTGLFQQYLIWARQSFISRIMWSRCRVRARTHRHHPCIGA